MKTNPSATLRAGVLYYGDNLDVLRQHISVESIDAFLIIGLICFRGDSHENA